MKRPQRTYEDYEELGRRFVAAERVLADLASEVMRMWPTEDAEGLPIPSQYDRALLAQGIYLRGLCSQAAAEYRAEAPDVPEDKPPVPAPFDRECQ